MALAMTRSRVSREARRTVSRSVLWVASIVSKAAASSLSVSSSGEANRQRVRQLGQRPGPRLVAGLDAFVPTHVLVR
jgi:hypothetical protein